MKVIYKYQIKLSYEIELPIGAEIIKVGVQRDCWYLWAIIDSLDIGTELRHFKIIATGEDYVPEGLKYIETFFQNNENLVWHLFEII